MNESVTEAVEAVQTIQLDCAPGPLRPWNLIQGVVEGTILEPLTSGDQVPCFFGLSVWGYPGISREVWERDVQPVIRPRIEALYRDGAIRYGSW